MPVHGNCAANIRPAIWWGGTGDVIERLSGEAEGLQLPDWRPGYPQSSHCSGATLPELLTVPRISRLTQQDGSRRPFLRHSPNGRGDPGAGGGCGRHDGCYLCNGRRRWPSVSSKARSRLGIRYSCRLKLMNAPGARVIGRGRCVIEWLVVDDNYICQGDVAGIATVPVTVSTPARKHGTGRTMLAQP